MLKHEWQWTPHGTLATMIHVAWQFQSYARQHQSMLHSSWCRSKSSFNRLYGLTRMGFWSSWEVLECHIQAYHPRPVSSWAWPSQTCQSYTRSRPLWTAPRKENLPMEDGIPVAPIPPDSSCCLEHEIIWKGYVRECFTWHPVKEKKRNCVTEMKQEEPRIHTIGKLNQLLLSLF